MLNVKLPASMETRLTKAAKRTGRTPTALTKAAVDLYLEELEDYYDVTKRKNERTISLAQLGKELGLGN